MSFAREMACIIVKTILFSVCNWEPHVVGGISPDPENKAFFSTSIWQLSDFIYCNLGLGNIKITVCFSIWIDFDSYQYWLDM